MSKQDASFSNEDVGELVSRIARGYAESGLRLLAEGTTYLVTDEHNRGLWFLEVEAGERIRMNNRNFAAQHLGKWKPGDLRVTSWFVGESTSHFFDMKIALANAFIETKAFALFNLFDRKRVQRSALSGYEILALHTRV